MFGRPAKCCVGCAGLLKWTNNSTLRSSAQPQPSRWRPWPALWERAGDGAPFWCPRLRAFKPQPGGGARAGRAARRRSLSLELSVRRADRSGIPCIGSCRPACQLLWDGRPIRLTLMSRPCLAPRRDTRGFEAKSNLSSWHSHTRYSHSGIWEASYSPRTRPPQPAGASGRAPRRRRRLSISRSFADLHRFPPAAYAAAPLACVRPLLKSSSSSSCCKRARSHTHSAPSS